MMRPNNWKNTCAVFLFCAMAAIASPAQTFTTLVNFNGANGGPDSGPLLQGFDGDFYGTTSTGGANSVCEPDIGCGTVFKMTTAGNLTTLYSFCALMNCTDGSIPISGLMQAGDGTFYGTTESGAFGGCCGTVFKMTREGTLATLFHFGLVNGGTPEGTLVQGADGNLYGTTVYGGFTCVTDGLLGCGTVFKITPAGVLTTLYNFCAEYSQRSCTDGAYPNGLVQGADGNLYGTTTAGGTNCAALGGCGTIFKITPAGKLTQIYNFCAKANCADGETPYAALVAAPNGYLYGTTYSGGTSSCFGGPGCGTVFKITPAGKLTTLHSFCSELNCADGVNPSTALAWGSDGNAYGSTSLGGDLPCGVQDTGCGTIFKITPAGALTTLHTFEGTDGLFPGPLVQGTDGTFYGVTAEGGSGGDGTIYNLSVGLASFVSLPQGSGKVGQSEGILGQGLTGTTGVFFNGTSANFTVESGTYMQATVPTGATTGYVTVTTPTGTLTSNVPFRVVP